MMELNSLSKLPRIGWVLAGVHPAESVSDHCYETALFTFVLSKYSPEPVDLAKALLMALFHEIGEARLTDLPRRSKPYIGKAKRPGESSAAADVLSGVAEDILPLLEEMHSLSTPEARLVEAAEELQIIFKSMVYAKENKGDMAEYRNDVTRYDPLGNPLAADVAKIIQCKLENYLGGKEYWSIGYRQRHDTEPL
jgi:putative hydrolase of HD superfamily